MPEVLFEVRDGYAIFTLNRPHRLNAFDTALREQFTGYLEAFNADPALRVGIVTGADLKEAAEGTMRNSPAAEKAHAGQFGRSANVFIAAVNGPCIAGAFEWTLDMDIRICTPEAYFGLLEVKRGRLASFGLERLTRMIPFGEAMYLVLTGDTMGAEQALRCGLVHEVVERERLIPRAEEIARMIVANHPRGVEGARRRPPHDRDGRGGDAPLQPVGAPVCARPRRRARGRARLRRAPRGRLQGGLTARSILGSTEKAWTRARAILMRDEGVGPTPAPLAGRASRRRRGGPRGRPHRRASPRRLPG